MISTIRGNVLSSINCFYKKISGFDRSDESLKGVLDTSNATDVQEQKVKNEILIGENGVWQQIFSLLSYDDLAKVRLVCQQFNLAIKQSKLLQARIILRGAEKNANLIEDSEIKIQRLWEIAKIDPTRGILFDLKTILIKHFQSNDDCSSLETTKIYWELVEMEAKENIKEALRTVNLVSFPSHSTHFESSKEQLRLQGLGEIVRVEAKRNIEHAIEIAKSEQSVVCRVSTLVEIAKIFPRDDILDLVVDEILKDESNLDLYLIEVIAVKASQSIEAAKKMVSLLKKPEEYADRAYGVIVKEEAKIDVNHAKITVGFISNPTFIYEAYINIVKEEAKIDVNYAKNTASLINDQSPRGDAFLEIVKVEVKKNIEDAKRTAGLIENLWHQVRAYLIIIEEEVKKNHIEDAEKTVRLIANDYSCMINRAFAIITEIKAREDLGKAKEWLLDNFPKNSVYSHSCINIVKVEAEKNLQEAKKTALLVNDRHRSCATLEIVKVEAKHDPKEAIITANSIKDESNYRQAIVEIVNDVEPNLTSMKEIFNQILPSPQSDQSEFKNKRVLALIAFAEKILSTHGSFT